MFDRTAFFVARLGSAFAPHAIAPRQISIFATCISRPQFIIMASFRQNEDVFESDDIPEVDRNVFNRDEPKNPNIELVVLFIFVIQPIYRSIST